MYAINIICELFSKRQHKAKTVTLSTVGETMVECFKRLQMALRTTTNGWCPTTPTLPKCLMHILTLRCLPILGVSNTFLNTFTKVLTVLQWWSLVQQTKSNNTLTPDIWALLKGSIPYFCSKNIWNGLPVTRLVVHFPRQHSVIFNKNEDLAVVAECATCQRFTLTTYFAYNAQNADGQNVVYADFLVDHVWKIRKKVWLARPWGEKVVGWMYFVHPTANEHFFLHLLLIVVLGVTSFEHLWTIDDIKHPTFQAACGTLGLLQDDA